MEEGMACGGMAFPGSGSHLPDVGYIYFVWNV